MLFRMYCLGKKGGYNVAKLIILAFVAIVCFLTGRYMAGVDERLFKKKLKNYHSRTINNYIGNMLSLSGLAIFAYYAFGIGNYLFFLTLAFIVGAAFCIHASEAEGIPLQNIDELVWGGKIQKLKMYPVTLKLIGSLIITGVISVFLYPVLFPIVEQPKTTEQNNFMEEFMEEYEKNGGFTYPEKNIIRVQ